MLFFGYAIIKTLSVISGDRLFVLVGQEGQSACVIQGVESRDGLCAMQVLEYKQGQRGKNVQA